MGKNRDMTIIEKIIYILTEYKKGNYTTADFCDLFEEYYREVELLSIPKTTENWLTGLDELCGRFSQFQDDHRNYPGVFYTDEDIRTYTENFSIDMLNGKI